MFASDQSIGKVLVSREHRIMVLRPIESSLAQALRTIYGMLSGPNALDISRLINSFFQHLWSPRLSFSWMEYVCMTNLEECCLSL